MHQDARGLTLTTSSQAAAEQFDTAVTDYLDYRSSAFVRLKAAIDEDPEFVMALYFRACFFQMMETGAVLPKVLGWIAELQPLLGSVTPRERDHVEALEAWAGGDIISATRRWEAILDEHPRDILALKLHHYLTFWTGRTHALRAAVAGVLPAWDETVPGYASVQGMYAFALEECGNLPDAERWGREAVERNGNDLWAIHSVAHVLETQGRSAEGVDWLDYPGDAWSDRNPFNGHVWWHAALFNLAQANYDKVLSLYDNELSAVNTPNAVDVQNQASLLKRLDLRGVNVGDRWTALAEHAEARLGDHVLAFNDMHWCLALAAVGNKEGAERHIEAMISFGQEDEGWTAHAFNTVGITLCRAMVAYETGGYGAAVDLLWPIKDDLSPIGGSHAQRDLFSQILADAALRDGRFATARGLYAERVVLRPTAATDWRHYGDALVGLGDKPGAAIAHQRAEAAAEPAA